MDQGQITVREYTPFRTEEILPLYRSVGWTRYTKRPEMLKEAVRHSLKVLTAYDGDQLVGLILLCCPYCPIKSRSAPSI